MIICLFNAVKDKCDSKAMQWMLDQLMKNAPFGNDYTPRPPCRMHVLPNENNQQTNQRLFSPLHLKLILVSFCLKRHCLKLVLIK